MFNRTTWIILALAVLAAALGGWLQQRSQRARNPDNVPAISIGSPAPELTLRDLQGAPHRLSDYRGARVLVNFWASWCVPCREEMPALDRAAADGLTVIGIAMDDPDRVRAFLAAHPVHYPVLLGELDAPSSAQQLGDLDQVLPYSVLLDADGRVLQARRGELDATTLHRWGSKTPAR